MPGTGNQQPRDRRPPAPFTGSSATGPDAASGLWLCLCLAVIDVAATLVPRAQRDDWRDEWRAELWHRSRRRGIPPVGGPGSAGGAAFRGDLDDPAVSDDPSRNLRIRRPSRWASLPRADLVVRALGAIRHAVWLRSQEWKPDMIMQDLRYAVRALRRAPTFTVMALLTLGVGIGANAVVFNMMHSVLMTPYPYEDAEQVVDVHSVLRDRGGMEGALSYPTYIDIRAADIFEEIAVWDWEPMNLRGDDETLLIGVGQVTHGLFDVLRVDPVVGRGFTAEEDVPGQNGVVVLTEGLWRSQYGADPQLIGRTIQLDGMPRVIVGVMPEEFTFPDEIEAWVPLATTAEAAPRSSNWLGSLARMKPGMTIEQTNAALRSLAEGLEEAYPQTAADRGLAVKSLRDDRVGEVRPFMYILLGAVGFLLLIVCANVANLLLARASAREREVSVRLALGASRTRLVRQLLTESLLLSLGGLAIGFAFSSWAGNAILSTIPLELPVWIDTGISASDVMYIAGVALAATVLFGLAPALQATRPDVQGTLAETTGRAAGGRGRRFMRHALVVAEVAISLMLLVGAGLMARSLTELSSEDPGFAPENRLMGTMQMPRGTYQTNESRIQLYEQMMERLAALPGVRQVAAVSRMPTRGSSNSMWFMYEGQDVEEAMRSNPSALHNSISPSYLDTMDIPLLGGRGFTDADDAGAPRVVLVNQEVAARHFPEGDAVGRRISFDGESWWEIAGIVGSVRHFGLAVRPELQVYVPYAQWPQGRLSIVLHTAGDPAAMAPQLRAEIRAIDPDQALYDVMPVTEAVRESFWMESFFATLMRAFALIAAAIAAVGIYGVTSYSISRRTQELGVRMALGAGRAQILSMVIRQSMTVVAIGIAIGLLLALAQGMALQSLLYEISGTDPMTFAAVVALILAVGLLATWLPARRATRLDPVRALRDE